MGSATDEGKKSSDDDNDDPMREKLEHDFVIKFYNMAKEREKRLAKWSSIEVTSLRLVRQQCAWLQQSIACIHDRHESGESHRNEKWQNIGAWKIRHYGQFRD